MAKNFFFFGDSIAYGQRVSIENSWVNKFAVWLNTTYSKNKFVVQNSSVLGNTTHLALSRIYNDVLYRNPSLLYIQFGINDCNIWQTEKLHPRVSEESFAANLKEIVDRTYAYDPSIIIFIGTNHPLVERNHFVRNQKYNDIIRRIAVERNLILVDHEKYLWETFLSENHLASKRAWCHDDQIHLNEMGNDHYFNNLKSCFEKLNHENF